MSPPLVKGLPAQFTLTISQSGGVFTVKSDAHPGLLLAHRNLSRILADVPLTLTTLLKPQSELPVAGGGEPS